MRAQVFPYKDAVVRPALGAEPREPGNFAPLLRQIFTDRLTLIDVTPKGGLAIRGAAAVDRPVVSEIDQKMMERCVELSRTVRRYGEFPFASLVCNGEVVVSEEINQVDRNGDVTCHAELMGVWEAQRVLGRNDLSDYAIYSNVEPGSMGSFPIGQTRISKVVFAIRSP
jgi:tRNA(Arg) A34 adenosine deaminase TadA